MGIYLSEITGVWPCFGKLKLIGKSESKVPLFRWRDGRHAPCSNGRILKYLFII